MNRREHTRVEVTEGGAAVTVVILTTVSGLEGLSTENGTELGGTNEGYNRSNAMQPTRKQDCWASTANT